MTLSRNRHLRRFIRLYGDRTAFYGQRGLFRITSGLYQVRNFDNSNVSFIETPNGWIIIDPLTVAEVARAAFDLVKKHVADKPLLAIIYTHSHSDHFAGAPGIVDPADVASGKVKVIAPKGFVEEVVSEWMIAGTDDRHRPGLLPIWVLLAPRAKRARRNGNGHGHCCGPTGLYSPRI